MPVKEYEYIMGIDTNTRIANDQKFSVCTYFLSLEKYTNPLTQTSFHFRMFMKAALET